MDTLTPPFAGYELYRANVERAIAGKRGQRFFRDLVAALDAMPPSDRKLIAYNFTTKEGCCAIGAVARYRDVDLSDLEPAIEHGESTPVRHGELGRRLDIARCLSAEDTVRKRPRWSWLRHQRDP